MLASDNAILGRFFKDLSSQIPRSYKSKPWQAGNAPLSVFIWKLDWQECFVEGWFPKICLSLNKNTRAHSHAEPNFAFSVFLWHTDWCHNRQWFLQQRKTILDHCFSHDFKIVRNTKGKWHTQHDWGTPYLETDGLKYVNSFPQFRLNESDYCEKELHEIASILQKQLYKIAAVIDRLESKVR